MSHTPIDQIERKDVVNTTLGGPTSYCGLTAKAMNLKVRLVTKIGLDFPQEFRRALDNRGLKINDGCISTKNPSTRFKLILKDYERELYLLAKCDDIGKEDIEIDTDACIISPVLNEIHTDAINEIIKRTNFVFVDPQGFVRRVASNGLCHVDNAELPFDRKKINVMKVDAEEAFALTGMHGVDALRRLGVKTAILTGTNKTIMLDREHVYEIATDVIESKDSTGAGDILAAAFTSSFLKRGELDWGLCYGVSAAISALKRNAIGIEKVPSRREIENYAYILHEDMKVRHV